MWGETNEAYDFGGTIWGYYYWRGHKLSIITVCGAQRRLFIEGTMGALRGELGIAARWEDCETNGGRKKSSWQS